MARDLAYYRRQPYQRVWETRDDAGERYFLVRFREFPRIAGDGVTRAEALGHLRQAFDDFITWRIEDELDIPEPARGTIADDLPCMAFAWVEPQNTRDAVDETLGTMDCWDLKDPGEQTLCPASVAESLRQTSEIVDVGALLTAA
jgi:predicted RNase H-like HicB family nuclease